MFVLTSPKNLMKETIGSRHDGMHVRDLDLVSLINDFLARSQVFSCFVLSTKLRLTKDHFLNTLYIFRIG